MQYNLHTNSLCSGSDFGDETRDIIFPALSAINTVRCANFSIEDDSVVEGVESFVVTGSGGSFVGGASIQIDITDNDSKYISHVARKRWVAIPKSGHI